MPARATSFVLWEKEIKYHQRYSQVNPRVNQVAQKRDRSKWGPPKTGSWDLLGNIRFYKISDSHPGIVLIPLAGRKLSRSWAICQWAVISLSSNIYPAVSAVLVRPPSTRWSASHCYVLSTRIWSHRYPTLPTGRLSYYLFLYDRLIIRFRLLSSFCDSISIESECLASLTHFLQTIGGIGFTLDRVAFCFSIYGIAYAR